MKPLGIHNGDIKEVWEDLNIGDFKFIGKGLTFDDFSIEYDESFETTIMGNPLGEDPIFIRNGANYVTQGSDEGELLGITSIYLNLDDFSKVGFQGYDVENNSWTFGSLDLSEGFDVNTDTQFNFIGNITASNLNIADWDTAFGWGNHASAGYLTSFTETDPLSLHLDQTTPQTISNGAPSFAGGLNISGSNLVMKSTGNKISFEYESVERAYIDMGWDIGENESSLRLIADRIILGDIGGTAVISAGEIDVNEVVTVNLYLGDKESEGSWKWSSVFNAMNFGLWDGVSAYDNILGISASAVQVFEDFQVVKDSQFQGEVDFVSDVFFNRDANNWFGDGETVNDYVIKYSDSGAYNGSLVFSRVATTTPSITTEETFYLHEDGVGVGGSQGFTFGPNNEDNSLRFIRDTNDISFQTRASSVWGEQINFSAQGVIEQKGIKVNTGDDTNFYSDEWSVNLGDFGGALPEDLILKASYLIGTAYSSLPEVLPIGKVLAVSDGLYILDESDRDEFEIVGLKKDLSDSIGIGMSLTDRSFQFDGHLLPDPEYYAEEEYLDIGADGQEWNNLFLRGDVQLSEKEGTIYMGEPTLNGTWRFIRVGNNLEFQRRESGSWVKKGEFTS